MGNIFRMEEAFQTLKCRGMDGIKTWEFEALGDRAMKHNWGRDQGIKIFLGKFLKASCKDSSLKSKLKETLADVSPVFVGGFPTETDP